MIVKHKLSKDFAILPNSVANDSSLSFKARGVLLYCLSKPENWKVISADLEKNSPKEGRDAVRGALRELQESGYAYREPMRDEKGQVLGTEWIISDTPSTEGRKNRLSVKPTFGETDCRQNGDYKELKETKNREEQRTDSVNVNRETPEVIYGYYPRPVGRKAALKAIKAALKETPYAEVCSKTIAFADLWKGKDLQFCPHPATWFNQRRFMDPLALQAPHDNGKHSQNTPINHRNVGIAGDAAKRQSALAAAVRANAAKGLSETKSAVEKRLAEEVAGP